MSEMVIRFLVGGVVVSLFAMLGDVLRPMSFAGLFGAAPSIARHASSLPALTLSRTGACWRVKMAPLESASVTAMAPAGDAGSRCSA